MKTADLVDAHDEKVAFCDLPFRRFGRRTAFHGRVDTVRCFEDNALLKSYLQKPGEGRVTVVDGGGSTRLALLGDMIAEIMRDNGRAGIVINGSVRDCEEIDAMDVGVRCLATSPRKSAKDGAMRRDLTVHFGGVEFRPGDYVYVDADGVLVSREALG